MCNLYDIAPVGTKRSRGWGLEAAEAMERLPKVYGIRKTDHGLVMRRDESARGGLRLELRRWGFHRAFNPAINNARVEKLADGLWSSAWLSGRRCVIPVASFYEWSGPKGAKQTHAFQSAQADDSGEGPATPWLWMAGLWEDDPEHGPRFTMLTTAASGAIATIHERMPAILPKTGVESYLDLPTNSAAEAWLAARPFRDDLKTFRCLNPMKSARPGPPVEDAFLF